jgi:excisionase family DNA binding protein
MSTMSILPGFLELHEVAKRLHVSHSMAARYVRDGRIKSVEVGNVKLVPKNALEGFKKKPRGNPNFTKKKPTGKKSA